MNSVKYLDQLKTNRNLKNDVALCEVLNWSSGQISQYRSGKRIMDNEACLALALALNIDPLRVIMAADIDRAARAGQRSLWEVFSKRTATAAGIIVAVLVTNVLTPSPAQAAPMLKLPSGKLYVMSNRRRKLQRMMRAIFGFTNAPATA